MSDSRVTPISLSPEDAAEAMGVSRRHMYRLIRTSEISSAKSGTRVLVDYQSMLDYFERNRRSA
ncbi:helix-turn-helix domain-containing protein [Aeromicrobium sp.]|uniref:helix-turn-helix domain-containing protein n=1 Tax=Aeromicrobium sp. TaxID=1871063 RepID=UPI002FC765FC